MPFLEIEDVKIHYETFGEDNAGPWITLVNGYTRTLADFKFMGRFLAERGSRVLTFDNRGAGEAECPPVFTLSEIGDDILALWDHLHCEQSHLLGISYGGAIAMTLASRVPEKIRSLILVSTTAEARDLSSESAGPSRDPRRLAASLSRYFSEKFIEKNQLLVQGFIRQMGKVYQELDTSLGARAQRASMEGMNLLPLLSRISCPTLIVHGEKDRVIPKTAAEKIAKAIPHAELRLIPDVGHLLLAEMPRPLYELVDEYCKKAS